MDRRLEYNKLQQVHKGETHLGSHDTLPLGDEVTAGTGTVLKLAMSLVSLEPADHAVVATAGALGLAGALLRGGVAQAPATAHAVHALQRPYCATL